MAIVQVGTHT